jgi:CRP-like cAMP-binding protein
MNDTAITRLRPANKVLACLKDRDLELLSEYLRPCELPVRATLESRRRPVREVYFLESGLASVVTEGKDEIEVGMIGFEGMTGISALLAPANPIMTKTYMQIAGQGRFITAENLRHCFEISSSLRDALTSYTLAFINQISETAMANARGTIEQRLARWILMAHDRARDDSLPIPHAYIAVMLGIRRAGVTNAIGELRRLGMIQQRRGGFTILDRDALLRVAGNIYTPHITAGVSSAANSSIAIA